MDPELKTLYRETLLKHSRDPENLGVMEGADISQQARNPLCGDSVTIYLKLRDKHIEAASFDAQCCSICMASASMLTRRVTGISFLQSKIIADSLIEMLSHSELASAFPENDELQSLSGVKSFPSRIRCATLPWEAFNTAISKVK